MKIKQPQLLNLRASYTIKSIGNMSQCMALAMLGLICAVPVKANVADFEVPQKPPTQKRLLAHSTKSAVVRIVNGCQGKAYLPRNGKTYNLTSIGYGSGYFVTSNGYIVTNAHVTQLSQNQAECMQLLFQDFVKQVYQDYVSVDLNTLKTMVKRSQLLTYTPIQQVLLQNGKALPFEQIVSGAPNAIGKDVAIIKIDVKNVPILKLANSRSVQLLDRITVIGYPAAADSTTRLSDDSFHVPSITDGAVSAMKTTRDGEPVIQTSASVTHGNSGGPAVNEQGEVIGIVAFRGDTVNNQEVQGFSFVIPSNTIREFIKLAGIQADKEEISQK
ncbi:trypsin-like serine protease [Scytonema sp. UIC 10036]|nr:trypsin-like serine protease [Scytonema sp. UIC 10036]